MSPEQVLAELLERLGANKGAAVLVSEEELASWPESAVSALKKEGLLSPASPAGSVVCPGCEEQCVMPVQTLAADKGRIVSFIVCDKRDDISRVPLRVEGLRQWCASLLGLAGLLSRLLDLPGSVVGQGARCELGVLRGRRYSSQVALIADGALKLHIAGHTADVEAVLTLKAGAFAVDRVVLAGFADKPAAGGGDVESAAARGKRLAVEVRAEKAKGTKAFLKTVAGRENISVQRLKQLLRPKTAPAKKRHRSSPKWTG